jgi:hypothetical protein
MVQSCSAMRGWTWWMTLVRVLPVTPKSWTRRSLVPTLRKWSTVAGALSAVASVGGAGMANSPPG